jgi:hypothetical protein
MINIIRAKGTWLIGVSLVGAIASLILCASAQAGNYVVVQCSAGLNPHSEAVFSSDTSHFSSSVDCNQNSLGLQLKHGLPPDATGTQRDRYGAWTWKAPAGTVISGGSAYSRLESGDGISGYLAVTPDLGNSKVTENQNDDRSHLSAIPAGQWRYFVARLQCTTPNQGNRCVGSGAAAHTYIKQLRLQLTDASAPNLSIGGSMFDGGVRRGRQAVFVAANDQGAGIRTVQIKVNGVDAGGEDLSASCNPLPGNLTSSMAPCPPGLLKGYEFDTAQSPFRHGENQVDVCVFDYAQTGSPNLDCESRTVLVDSLCPASPVGGGTKLSAGFADKGGRNRLLRYGRRTMIRGQVRDTQGNPVPGATVCIQGRSGLTGSEFRLVGAVTTNANGGWSYKVRPKTSRQLRVAYRDGSFQISHALRIRVRATSTMHVNRRKTGPGRRVKFTGRIPGPHAARRVVVVYGTVPGANRRFLVRRARTNSMGRWRVGYAFTPVPVTTKFVFWAVVPQQNGYPFSQGRSAIRSVRVSP